MANIILELTQQIARVRAFLPKYDPHMRGLAAATVVAAERALAMNFYESMREAIDDLKELGDPNPAEAEK